MCLDVICVEDVLFQIQLLIMFVVVITLVCEDFKWLFSTKAYFKVCIEGHKIW